MRVTDNMTFTTASRAQERSAARLLRATQKASTGLRVGTPSDDPAAYADGVRHAARISVVDARSRTASRAADQLDVAENVLASGGELLVRAREVALEMANGSVDAATRARAARQIDGLREALLGIANQTGPEGYLFGGTRTDAPPFDAAGTFSGNDTPVRIEIADGSVADTRASGARAFTVAGGRDVFADLAALSTALASNNLVGIQNSLSQLDGGHRQLVAARVDAGLRGERLRIAADIGTQAVVRLSAARAGLVEVDAPSAFSELQAAQNGYEQGLAVQRRILAVLSRVRE